MKKSSSGELWAFLPEAPHSNTSSATGRISMKIAYGYHGIETDEELFDLAVKAVHYFDETAVFGVWMVDLFPARRFHVCQG